jgi:hypothetical protein
MIQLAIASRDSNEVVRGWSVDNFCTSFFATGGREFVVMSLNKSQTKVNIFVHRYAVGKEKGGERGEKRGERRKRKRGKERREDERERTVNRNNLLDLIMFNSIIMLFYLLFHSHAKF